MSKSHDLVVFGATGYTGGLVVEYLAEHAKDGLRWAIAGRDETKLRALADGVRSRTGAQVPFFVADVADRGSIDAMARSTSVLLTTVGPYATFGEPVVAACVDARTDYIDVTGEPEFVATIAERHDARARDAGVRIVSCCGFDSVPPDLGVYFVMDAMRPTSSVEVEGFIHASATLSGGTWQSMVGALSRWREIKDMRIPHPTEAGRRVHGRRPKPRFEPEVSGWVVPVPSINPQIVLRSAGAIARYGPDFVYGHFVRVGSLPKVAGLALGAGAAFGLAQFEPTRELLTRLKKSGEGAGQAQRDRAFFRVTIIAQSREERVIGRVSGGDAYAETAKMASEAAFALIRDRDRLPDRAGVLTPATAFEGVLVQRLQNVGVRFEIVRRTRTGPS